MMRQKKHDGTANVGKLIPSWSIVQFICTLVGWIGNGGPKMFVPIGCVMRQLRQMSGGECIHVVVEFRAGDTGVERAEPGGQFIEVVEGEREQRFVDVPGQALGGHVIEAFGMEWVRDELGIYAGMREDGAAAELHCADGGFIKRGGDFGTDEN